MSVQRIGHLIGLVLILSVLARCGVSAEPHTASPTATPAEERPAPSPEPVIEEEITIMEEKTIVDLTCPCFATVTMDAYLDQNENGKRDAYEPPLEGVRFWLEWYELVDLTTSRKETASAWSDATGHAERKVYGCGCDDVDVYPQVPPGYKLTTSDRCGSGACNFGFAKLPGTSRVPSEAELREGDLRGRDLREVNLSRVDLRGADLRGAKLLAADLSEADLTDANLRRASLRQADLSSADLDRADLRNADLSQANLGAASLREALLNNADLSGADLSGANLRWADLGSTDLSGTNLRGAMLRGASLHGAITDNTTRIEDRWRLTWEIVNQGGRGKDLSSTDLRFDDLHGADLCGADLSGVDLHRANLSGADLSEADLSGANLSHSNLSGANPSNSNLTETRLFSADLTMADLQSADLSLADLSGADLTGANVSDVEWQEARYDQDTKWPSGFDPVAAGAVLEE